MARSGSGFLYRRIGDRILEDALANGSQAGDELPTIQELTRRYGVSETPVRRALDLLKRGGRVRTVRGRGTFWVKAPDAPGQTSRAADPAAWEAYSPFIQTPARARLSLHLIDGLPFHREMWRGLIERFQRRHAETEVAVSFGQDTSALADKPAAEGPDLVQLSEFAAGRFAAQGRLLELPADLARDDALPAHALLPARYEGRTFGLPLTLSLPVQYANTQLLEQAGIAWPSERYAWTDFLNLARSLCEARRSGRWPEDAVVCASQDHAFPFLAARSLDCFDPVARHFDWSHPDVLGFFRDWALLGHGWGAIPPDTDLRARGGMHALFAQGRLAIVCMYAIFRELIPGGCPSFARALPIPRGPRGCAVWTANYLGVQPASRQRAAALDFLRFLCSEEARKIVQRAGCLPAFGVEPARAGRTEPLGVEAAALDGAKPASWFGAENLRFIGSVFAPLANQVRDGALGPEAAVTLLCEAAAGMRV